MEKRNERDGKREGNGGRNEVAEEGSGEEEGADRKWRSAFAICHADSHGLDAPETWNETVGVWSAVQINWLYISDTTLNADPYSILTPN